MVDVGSNWAIFKLEPFFKTTEMSQHITTGWSNELQPNDVAISCVKLLWTFGRPWRVNSMRQQRILVPAYRCRRNLKIYIFAPDLFLSPFMRRFSLRFSLRLHCSAPGLSSDFGMTYSSAPYISEEKKNGKSRFPYVSLYFINFWRRRTDLHTLTHTNVCLSVLTIKSEV